MSNTLLLNKVATYRLETGGVLFNEITEINSRPLVKKGLHQGGLPRNILELSAFLQDGLTWAALLWKNEDCVLQGCNFIKTLVHHIFFPQNIPFKTASFGYIFQRQFVLSSFYSKVAVVTLQACNFTERTPS